MLDLDRVLTLVGIVLVAIGVGVFLLGRSRPSNGAQHSNRFEAFGIKVDVSNPSVLLIMFGVVLILTPRFVPVGGEPHPAEPPALETHATQAPDAPEPMAPTAAGAKPQDATPPDNGPTLRLADAETAAPTTSQAAVAKPSGQDDQARIAAARELERLQAERRDIARQQEALRRERAALAAQADKAGVATLGISNQAAAVPAQQPASVAREKLVILTEALDYEGETDGSFRAKLHKELFQAVNDTLAGAVELDLQNPGFRKALRLGDMAQLCKGTRADHLLLADLTPVAVESFTVESANWPNMRYAAVNCADGRISRSDWMRMEPNRGDRFPLQQSVAGSARDFIRANSHLLQ